MWREWNAASGSRLQFLHLWSGHDTLLLGYSTRNNEMLCDVVRVAPGFWRPCTAPFYLSLHVDSCKYFHVSSKQPLKEVFNNYTSTWSLKSETVGSKGKSDNDHGSLEKWSRSEEKKVVNVGGNVYGFLMSVMKWKINRKQAGIPNILKLNRTWA